LYQEEDAFGQEFDPMDERLDRVKMDMGMGMEPEFEQGWEGGISVKKLRWGWMRNSFVVSLLVTIAAVIIVYYIGDPLMAIKIDDWVERISVKIDEWGEEARMLTKQSFPHVQLTLALVRSMIAETRGVVESWEISVRSVDAVLHRMMCKISVSPSWWNNAVWGMNYVE
jgi:hypothetical protein